MIQKNKSLSVKQERFHAHLVQQSSMIHCFAVLKQFSLNQETFVPTGLIEKSASSKTPSC